MQDKIYAGIYVRISSDREGRECGVVRQEEHCRDIARRLKLKVYRVYKDNDKGASKHSKKPRPEYKQLIEDARAGRIQVIIAYSSSRLTRRPMEHEGQIQLAEEHGITYHYFVSPAFDLNTAHGRGVARTLAAWDAAEAEQTSERVIDAKRQSAEEGRYMGGYRAFGYEGPKYDDDGNLLNRGRINIGLVEHEIEVYHTCVKRIIAGERAMTIIRDLNERGIPSPDGKQWVVGNFKRIMTKKRYVIFDADDPEQRGTLEHHGKEYRAAWPGVISRDEYELMMSRFNETAQPWAHGLSGGRKYLLSGFIYCGACGQPMIGSRRGPEYGHSRRYRCKSIDQHGKPLGCGKVFRSADSLEDYITDVVLDRFDTPTVNKALATSREDEAKISQLVTRLENHRARRRQLLMEYGRGEHTKQDYKVMLAAAEEAIEAVQTDLAKLRDERAANLLPANQAVRDAWETASLDWKRSVIKLLIERIDILPGLQGRKKYKDKWLFNPDLVQITWRDADMNEVAASLSVLMQTERSALALAA